jgi:hypothetical protein
VLSFQINNKSLEFLRFARLYPALCADDPVLAAYPALDALLAALDASSGADAPTRKRLICALITKHQIAPATLWSAIALHAFRGMLGRLSKTLVGIDPDEADSLVVCAFAEALTRVRPARDPARIALYVRQETRRVVFAQLERDARARPHGADDEEDEWADPPPDEPASDDESSGLATARARSRVVDPDTLADPASLVPIEDRLVVGGEPSASQVSDEDLMRAHAVRGGLRRLTNCLFEDAPLPQREHVYRQLLRRAQLLVARRSR